ncbi:MAG: homoserine dehydrogenase [Alphaproteobacteria bacterium]|nr:homoserine dehydrogenase [Alphaproteobacteria bacterium]
MQQRLALVGFGVVGQALASLLADAAGTVRALGCRVVAISDLRFGTVFDPAGLDLVRCLAEVRHHGRFTTDTRNWDALTMIRESNGTAVVELSVTDLVTGEPATSHCRVALEAGRNVVTCNKGPVALHHRALSALAATHGMQFLYEGTVMSGTPVFNLARNCLAGTTITGLRGILNGTTNYILGAMEAGTGYAAALAAAQAAGYAEANPEADVSGRDALAKVVILANALMGGALDPATTPCEGITGITPHDIARAAAEGCRYKLIGTVARRNGELEASVRPMALPLSDPLAGVGGVTNALTFTTDLLGETTIVGAGAGPVPTAYAIIADLLKLEGAVG